MKALLVVIVLVSAAVAQSSLALSRSASACGAANAQFQVERHNSPLADPQVDAGKALIYVVEDQKFKIARDVTVRVGIDGAWMGATRGNSYLFFTVDPGEHHFCADWTSNWLPTGRLVSFYGSTVESGKAYYLRARTISVTSADGRNESIDLELVNDDEGKYLVATLPLAVSRLKK